MYSYRKNIENPLRFARGQANKRIIFVMGLGGFWVSGDSFSGTKRQRVCSWEGAGMGKEQDDFRTFFLFCQEESWLKTPGLMRVSQKRKTKPVYIICLCLNVNIRSKKFEVLCSPNSQIKNGFNNHP